MIDLYAAAKARGEYEALGGHKARAGNAIDPITGRAKCYVCRRLMDWHETRHYTPPRRRKRG